MQEGADHLPSNMIDDEKLSIIFEKIYNGDENCLCELYDMSALHIYRFALSIVKYSYLAEEVVQETFLNIMLHCRKHRIKKAKSWLFTVVKNCCIKSLKNEHFSQKEDIDLYKDTLTSDDQTENINIPLNEIECLKVLDDNEFRIVLLCKIEGFTIPESANLLGLSRVRAKSVYDYAIKKIKKYYREKESNWNCLKMNWTASLCLTFGKRGTTGYRTFRVSVRSPVNTIVKDQESMLLLQQVQLHFVQRFRLSYFCL